jgi:hypothetical protein
MDKSSKTADGAGTSDPYTVLTYTCGETGKNKSVKTQTVKKTLRPDWFGEDPGRCKFLMQLRRGASVHLGVWDSDFGSSDYIGGATIDTRLCSHNGSDGGGWRGWVEIFTEDKAGHADSEKASRKGRGRKAGEVLFSFEWSGQPERRDNLKAEFEANAVRAMRRAVWQVLTSVFPGRDSGHPASVTPKARRQPLHRCSVGR